MISFRRVFKARRLRALRDARQRADEALRLAMWRKDTQGIHKARQRLRDATHALLRAELAL